MGYSIKLDRNFGSGDFKISQVQTSNMAVDQQYKQAHVTQGMVTPVALILHSCESRWPPKEIFLYKLAIHITKRRGQAWTVEKNFTQQDHGTSWASPGILQEELLKATPLWQCLTQGFGLEE
ncbi:hypothetical protein SADUNF_Sadunf10G0151100 [Salix dunnii]|uniref:Uncharacterized protein n=1 Tax=Salix dunnii TaxID=1413687 RepID=A0A835JNX6_9ROSI|nr:hypothetical protein SADUNF_Sadunf10G0151100 [Salix dunnii]